MRKQIYKLGIGGRAVGKLKQVIFQIASKLPGNKALSETQGSQVPIDFTRWFSQKILGINGSAYWPMHPSSSVSYPSRIKIGAETSPGWSSGCLINGINGIEIGDYTQISQNVAIVSANHDPYDLSQHLPAAPIKIGKYCLLGANCAIMPGVELGDYTIVGANAVVTRSFTDGHQVLGGAPAKVISKLDRSINRDYISSRPYHGYIVAEDFAEFEEQYLYATDSTSKS